MSEENKGKTSSYKVNQRKDLIKEISIILGVIALLIIVQVILQY